MKEKVRYFAYGSNMCEEQMTTRCPSAVFVGSAALPGYRRAFPLYSSRWSGFVAGLVPEPGGCVEGVLYEMSQKDLDTLDHYEGVEEGRYRRARVTVLLHNRSRATVWTYLSRADADEEGLPSQEYIDKLIKGAKEHNLPRRTVSKLEAVSAQVAQAEANHDEPANATGPQVSNEMQRNL